MDNVQFIILAGLGCISIVLGAVLLFKIKNVTYLLEQPIVKKLSPQIKLKPVKVDEIDDQARRNDRTPAAAPINRNNGRPGDRPEGERGDRGPRDQNRDRGPRPEGQRDGERGPRPEGDRGPRSDRGDRGDRFGGRDRDRGGRHDRHERHGGDRDRNRGPREFSNDRESGAGEARPMAPRSDAPRREESPMPVSDGPVLAPRRPLPSTVEHEEQKEISAAPDNSGSPLNDASVSDPMFAQNEGDIQHGRRNQLKKKPRFDVAEEESSTPEETKA